MNRTTLDAAVAEAERFLKRAKVYVAANPERPRENPKESGALRRSSMDLTRALADLRKSS